MHSKEVTARSAQIEILERSVRSLSEEKNTIFDNLQMRTAELESSQSHLEQMQSRSEELQFQLRNASEQWNALSEEVLESRQSRVSGSAGSSTEDISRLLLEAEGKYEARLSDARNKIRMLERERNQAEEEWNRGIND